MGPAAEMSRGLGLQSITQPPRHNIRAHGIFFVWNLSKVGFEETNQAHYVAYGCRQARLPGCRLRPCPMTSWPYLTSQQQKSDREP